jgi:hypothetical protein
MSPPTGTAMGTVPNQQSSSDGSRNGSGGLITVTTARVTPSSDRGSAAADLPIASDLGGVLATAVYVAGSTTLQSGHRYGIALRQSRLQILGPTLVDPRRVALDRPLAGLDARSVEGRLIVADASGLLLAFMAVDGTSTQALAATITEAARRGGQR